MEQFKFLSMKESFEENYKAVKVPAKNKKGFRMEYVYIGPWYVWTADPIQVKKTKIGVLNACVISLILYVVAALQDSPVNYQRLVSMTGLLSLAPFIFELFGVVQFWMSKEKMTNLNFDDISGKLKIAPVIHAALLFLCGALGIYAVVHNGFSRIQLLIPVCYGLAGWEALSVYLIFRKLQHKKIENQN
ncbi:MAG: hypothetical protein IJW67_06400 [Blautia sp.]|nr:hypothetical protein [Blautia sp.]